MDTDLLCSVRQSCALLSSCVAAGRSVGCAKVIMSKLAGCASVSRCQTSTAAQELGAWDAIAIARGLSLAPPMWDDSGEEGHREGVVLLS